MKTKQHVDAGGRWIGANATSPPLPCSPPLLYFRVRNTPLPVWKATVKHDINKPDCCTVAVVSESWRFQTGLGCAVSPVRFGSGGGLTVSMVKCVVSGCPNRVVNVNRGVFNRPPKRFFNFPKNPARVKVRTCESNRDSDTVIRAALGWVKDWRAPLRWKSCSPNLTEVKKCAGIIRWMQWKCLPLWCGGVEA